MSEYDYGQELKKQLEKDVYLRHLFNKRGREVIVELSTGVRLRGILLSIEFIRGVLNLELEDPQSKRVYYVNWRHVCWLGVVK